MCIWHEDADSFKRGDPALDIIYNNNPVRSYLSSTRALGIAATKGQGKTFLIKAKRNRLHGTKDVDDDISPVTCFPKDASLVDTVNKQLYKLLMSNHSIRGLLKTYGVWVSIWQFTIAAAIINSNEYKNLFIDNDFNLFSESVLFFFNRKRDSNTGNIVYAKNINNEKVKPSIVLSMILNADKITLQKIVNETLWAINLLDRINNGVYFFIDKIDQAFSESVYKIKKNGDVSLSANASYWQYIQYGLAEAAYSLLSANSHIKVFYTIRQEAILDSHKLAKNECRNIESFLVELSYSQEDIYQMFKLYVEKEKDECLYDGNLKQSNPEKALFGFDKIQHSFITDTTETTFNYVYRHSLRRPGDLMTLCKQIYLKNPKELNIRVFRRTINESSSRILKRYLSEVEPFITNSENDFLRLLSLINTNVFDLTYMKAVCERYNTQFGLISGCNKDCLNCNCTHPFSALLNIGLLGYLRDSFANPIPQQCFLPIGESKLKLNEHDLKSSELFFLHPCLCDIARNSRKSQNKEFFTCDQTIVGEGIQLESAKIIQIKQSLLLYINKLNDDKIFLSSTIDDLMEERKTVKETLFKLHMYPILSETDNFQYGYNDIHSHDHCIDEMLKCKQLVFIIGNEYGGNYSGNKYKEFAARIVQESGNKIENPSISLMEFYIARVHGLNYKVLVLQNVIDKKRAMKDGIQLHTCNCDPRVFEIVNFINHIQDDDGQKVGNWRLTFRNTKELATLLRHQTYTIDGSQSKDEIIAPES